MYVLPFSDILYAVHVSEKWLTDDDGYDGWPKHVGVKGIVCSVGNEISYVELYL